MNGSDVPEIQRFDPECRADQECACMTADARGEYVKAEDHQQVARGAARKEQIRESEVVEAQEHRSLHEDLRRKAEQRAEKAEARLAQAREEMESVQALLWADRQGAAEQRVHQFLTATPCSDQGGDACESQSERRESTDVTGGGLEPDGGLAPETSHERAVKVVVDFLDGWRFCPVATASAPARSCLEDAATQLLAALDSRPTQPAVPVPQEASEGWPDEVYVAVPKPGTTSHWLGETLASIHPGLLPKVDPDEWEERRYVPAPGSPDLGGDRVFIGWERTAEPVTAVDERDVAPLVLVAEETRDRIEYLRGGLNETQEAVLDELQELAVNALAPFQSTIQQSKGEG